MQPQNQAAVSSDGRPATAGLRAFFARRPIVSVLIMFLVEMAIIVSLHLLMKALAPNAEELITLGIASAITFAFISALGWWRASGFNRPAAWRDLRLLWLPAIIAFVLPFVTGFKTDELGSLGMLTVAYLLVGLREEALWRGVVLRILRPLGPTRGVLLMAALFGLSHLSNLAVRSNPAIVLSQVIGAFCFGVGMGALRLRTNTVWFLVILHAFSDLTLHYTNLPAIPLEVVRDTILLCYGLYLLRGQHAADARDAALNIGA
jgi:membrane protease YdiL (CAAX protease family)